jgi:hypothetical protein
MAETPKDLAKTLGKIETTTTRGEPVHVTEDEGTGHRFLIYSTASGIKVQLQFSADSLWMTQAQMAELFGRDVSVISRHIANVIEEGELPEEGNLQKVQSAGSTRPVAIYSLDMVISVGYRVSSGQATLFRRWATDKLVQFATKGFVIDVERLRDPDERDHFRELREIIREIRASEKNVYRELREIIALCSDYSALDEHRKNAFFASVQNKLLYAVTNMTAAELRIDRADAAKPNMGLTSWRGKNIGKADVVIAKNYLGDAEIRDLNRFTNMLLDYFEQETELRRLVLTVDADEAVDRFVRNNERPLLSGPGSVSKTAADDHCRAEYDKFNDMRRLNYVRDEQE